jgi:photosystem II stability/assembly factor-like uncharacterized protein
MRFHRLRLLLIASLAMDCAAWAVPSRAADAVPPVGDVAWHTIGPGGGGWIQSIACDPANAQILHVGCDVGGYYFSADSGRSYEVRNAGLRDYFIQSIAVHPRRHEVMILGTQSGIHRSTDQGRSWQWIRTGFPPLAVYKFSAPIAVVRFDPQRPEIVLAGVGRPRLGNEGAGAIYRSDDTGLTWRLISAGQLPADAIVSDIQFQGGNDRTLLAATQHGVFRSDDGGNAWQPSSRGLPQLYVEQLALARSAPQVVYATLRTAARDGQPFDGGVYRSADAGRTWRAANGPGMPHRVGRSAEPAQMTSNLRALAVDPRNADVVYVGDSAWVTAGVYQTVDGGRHWRRTTSGPGSEHSGGNMDYGWIRMWGPGVECLALDAANPNRIAFGTSGHVFLSEDGGESWRQRYGRTLPDGRCAGTGLETTCQFRLVADPVRRGRLYGCYYDVGLLISDDGGQSFRRSAAGMKFAGNCFAVAVDPQSPATLWAATGQWASNQGDVCRSDDDGRSWRVVGNPESGLPLGQTRHLLLDPRSTPERRRLLVSCRGHGLYESRDGGRAWQAINGDLPAAAVKEPRGLLLDAKNPGLLTVALAGRPDDGSGVYQTRDGGHSWRRLNREPIFDDVECLAADPHRADVFYLAAREAYDSRARHLYQGGLFASRDGGATWQRLLADRFVQTVAVSPADSRVIYAGTNDYPYHDQPVAQGLLKSSDGGLSWHRENAGLTVLNVNSIGIDPRDPAILYLSTAGNSAAVGRDRAIRPLAGAPER